MSATDLTTGTGPPVAHPLARELAAALASCEPPKTLLIVGVGSGRNIAALAASGARIEALEADAERAAAAGRRFAADGVRVRHGSYAEAYGYGRAFAGALATHALLHGSGGEIAAAVEALHAALEPRGLLFATFGSTRDPRCGAGRHIEARTYAPLDGPERGVSHTYFDEAALRRLLVRFDVTLEERSAAETAGRWAHSAAEARELRHWFVRAKAR